MAAKRTFPPEWYAAQAARRKQRAESKASGSSVSKSTSRKKQKDKPLNYRGDLYHRDKKLLLSMGDKATKFSTPWSSTRKNSGETFFIKKKDGGIAALSRTTRAGEKRWDVRVKLRKNVSPEVYKRYLRMFNASSKTGENSKLYSRKRYKNIATDY